MRLRDPEIRGMPASMWVALICLAISIGSLLYLWATGQQPA